MRIFIAETDQELRLALQMLLIQEADMRVIGIADQGEGLVNQVAVADPDLLLLDWNLPCMSMRDLLADLQALERQPKIVVLSVRPEEESAAMDAGADAYATKDAPPNRLIQLLQTIGSEHGSGAVSAPGDESV